MQVAVNLAAQQLLLLLLLLMVRRHRRRRRVVDHQAGGGGRRKRRTQQAVALARPCLHHISPFTLFKMLLTHTTTEQLSEYMMKYRRRTVRTSNRIPDWLEQGSFVGQFRYSGAIPQGYARKMREKTERTERSRRLTSGLARSLFMDGGYVHYSMNKSGNRFQKWNGNSFQGIQFQKFIWKLAVREGQL